MTAAATHLFDAMTILLMILAGRFLGEAQFGMFSFAQSLALVCMGLGNSGLAALMTNDISRSPETAERNFSLVLPWAFLVTTLVGVAMVTGMRLAYPDTPMLVFVVAVMGGAMLLRGLVILVRCFLRGLQRFDLEFRAVALENLVLIPTAIVVLFLGGDVLALALAMLAGRFAGMIFQLLAIREEISLRIRIAPREILPIARAAFPVGVSQALFMLIQQADNLVLVLFVSFAEIGEFNAAMKIYAGCLLFPTIIASVLMPRLSASAAIGRDSHNGYLILSVLSLVLVALLGIVIGLPLSDFTIRLLFGDGFESSGQILAILVVAMLPAFQVYFFRNYLIIMDRKPMMIVFSALGLAVRLLLAFSLVSQYGIWGAAVSVLISESLIAVALWIYIARVQLKVSTFGQFRARFRDAIAALT